LADIGQHQRGLDAIQRSLEIDPSNAQAYVARGAMHALMGQTVAGIDEMRYGMRISPRDKRLGFWRWWLGRVLLRARRPEEALQEALISAVRDPKLHLSRVLEAAALQDLGRTAEAVDALARARRLRPKMTLDEIGRSHEGRIAELIEPLWRDTGAGATQ
jgi:tetratricopeptide (TPR) repeat protein